MRMSNYLSRGPEARAVMAVTQSSFGMGHLTVVPTNFEPEEDETDDQTATADDE